VRVEVTRRGVRVEAELVGGTAHQTSRQEPVERHLSRERPLKERCVCDRAARRDERLGTSDRTEHRRVDARRWREARTRDAPGEAQLVPRSPGAAEQSRRPDRRSFRREPPLDDRIELRQWHSRVAEQAAEDGGADSEREVGDHGEVLVRKADRRRVLFDHLDPRIAAETRAQLSQRGRVELDRVHARACVRKRPRQDTGAGAEVEHEHAGIDAGVADELVCEGATTKRVATGWPRLR
jgi:hypothetical protein